MKKCLLILFIPLISCTEAMPEINDSLTSDTSTFAANDSTPPHPLQSWLDPMLADGFDFPVGNKDGKGSYSYLGETYHGWYIAANTGEHYDLGIHTGEDWNGNGGGNSDLGQPVYAIGKGKVLAASNFGIPWGNIVVLEHRFIENNIIKKVFSLYAHLESILPVVGDTITRRQQIGTIGTGDGAYPAHLHLEIRKASMAYYPVDYWPSAEEKDQAWVLDHYEAPSSFIEQHRQLTVPLQEKQIVIAVKHTYQLYLFEHGVEKAIYDIALSQNPIGHKQQQGDNRLPEGAYRIIQKSRAPFSGSVAEFFGVAWMRISYPNNYDAKAGYRTKLISKHEMEKIIAANNVGKEPSKHTKLGGGIGIHGWAGEWVADGTQHLTWGCISMNNSDLDIFYDLIELQTKIIIIK